VALACEACQDGCIAHTTLELWVDEQLKFIASKALLTFCTKAEVAPIGCQGSSIYLKDEKANPTTSHAMEMPGCSNAFHRKCITKWFTQRSTYSMCQQDLSMYLDPTVQRFLLHFTEEDY
jgi:hypothetical protein